MSYATARPSFCNRSAVTSAPLKTRNKFSPAKPASSFSDHPRLMSSANYQGQILGRLLYVESGMVSPDSGTLRRPQALEEWCQSHHSQSRYRRWPRMLKSEKEVQAGRPARLTAGGLQFLLYAQHDQPPPTRLPCLCRRQSMEQN